MLARALLITFQQALRSIALLLFPLMFIALVAWSTAGSSTGNTGDPARAAIWLWLGAHLIPFSLHLPPAYQEGALSFLPLGAVPIVIAVMRHGYGRARSALGKNRPAKIFFSFWYLLAVIGATYLSGTSEIKASLWFAPLYSLVLLLISFIDFSRSFYQRLKLAAHLLLIAIGLASIFFGLSLALHFSIVKNITVVVQPGWVGGVLLLALQILYLPNIALATLSYLWSGGLTVGAGTFITPRTFTLQDIPAIPVLGGLPTSTHPLYVLIVITLFIFVAILIIANRRWNFSLRERIQHFFIEGAMGGIILLALGFTASGSLLTRELSPVGVMWWFLSSAFLIAYISLFTLIVLLPATIKKLRTRVTE